MGVKKLSHRDCPSSSRFFTDTLMDTVSNVDPPMGAVPLGRLVAVEDFFLTIGCAAGTILTRTFSIMGMELTLGGALGTIHHTKWEWPVFL